MAAWIKRRCDHSKLKWAVGPHPTTGPEQAENQLSDQGVHIPQCLFQLWPRTYWKRKRFLEDRAKCWENTAQKEYYQEVGLGSTFGCVFKLSLWSCPSHREALQSLHKTASPGWCAEAATCPTNQSTRSLLMGTPRTSKLPPSAVCLPSFSFLNGNVTFGYFFSAYICLSSTILIRCKCNCLLHVCT